MKLLALLATACAMAGSLAPSAPASAQDYPSYVLKNNNSHLCLGVYGASGTQGAKLVQWNCGTATSDDILWYWADSEQLHNEHSKLCLAIYGGDQTGNRAGGKAVQWNCGSSLDQKWHTIALNPPGDHVLLIDAAGHCLGIPGNSTTQGVQPDAEICANQNHPVPGQVWEIF